MKDIRKAMTSYLSDIDASEGFRLVHLWRSWEDIFGPDLAALARPMGHRKRTLLIGAEDHLALQELTYYAPQLLEAVNEFLGEEFFDKVHVDLIMGKAPLDTHGAHSPWGVRYAPPEPENLGALKGKLPSEHPVARCYEAYVRYFKGNKENTPSRTPAGDGHDKEQGS